MGEWPHGRYTSSETGREAGGRRRREEARGGPHGQEASSETGRGRAFCKTDGRNHVKRCIETKNAHTRPISAFSQSLDGGILAFCGVIAPGIMRTDP